MDVLIVRRLLAAGALALLVSAPARSAPDSTHGEQVYARCQGCHALTADRVGPRHCGLFARLAGSVPDFDYSAAMRGSGIRWSDVTLDRFLSNPLKMVPGTSMTYDGISNPQDRADLIAYLKHANQSPECAKVAAVKR